MREIERSPESVGRQVRPPSRETSICGSVGQLPTTARQARVAELTASSRLTGARPVPGVTVLEGSRDAVVEVVGSGLEDLGAEVGDGLVPVGEDRVADGGLAGSAWAVSERDLSLRTSKVSNTTLTKTNPPTATFGQWPFRMSGMRRSLTAEQWSAVATGQRPRPVTVAGLPATISGGTGD
jgi:hypothetical protein